MSDLKAFIGHSFTEDDRDVVRQFIDFFNNVSDMGIGFSWEHAEAAEPKILSKKVLELMEGKNLFIAICTSKELAITSEKLRGTWFNKKMVKANVDDFATKTSDWIIQEIGAAIGKNMDIIILLEEGLRKPGGLQGDLEYIEFSRSEPSKSFNKILEMLKALVPKKAIGHIAQMVIADQNKEEIVKGKIAEDLTPSKDWARDDYDRALFNAIVVDDKEREEKIIKAFIDSGEAENDSDKDEFIALKYYYRQIFGKGIYVEELKDLSNKHPVNSFISFYLARAYEKYEDFSKAAMHYEKAATTAKSDKRQLKQFCNAAEARCKNGDGDAASWLLKKARRLIPTVDNGEYEILSTLKNIYDLQTDNEKYLAYAESILDIVPEDHGLRFSLAYKYSELKHNELSLLHYSLIQDTDRNSTTWNNLGVALSRLDIEGKAVDAYRRSESMSGTLAMSNLAHKFLGAGFLREAEEICNRAVKIDNYDKTVGSAIDSIKKTQEEENEKYKKILKDVENRRRFYIEFGKSSIKAPSPDEIEGIWFGPECNLTIEIKGANFIAKGSYQRTETPRLGLAALYAGYSMSAEEKVVEVNVRYEGKITGLGIEFKLYIDDEGKKSSLLTAIPFGSHAREGLMIIADGMKEIKVYEKGTKETEKFYSLRRK